MPGGMVMYAGFVVSLLLQWLTGWPGSFGAGEIGAIFVALLLPALLSGTLQWSCAPRHGLVGFSDGVRFPAAVRQ